MVRGRREDLERRLKENTTICALHGSDGVGASLSMIGREESNRSGPARGVECKSELKHLERKGRALKVMWKDTNISMPFAIGIWHTRSVPCLSRTVEECMRIWKYGITGKGIAPLGTLQTAEKRRKRIPH